MDQHEKINYLELYARDFAATKAFFTAVFDWEFQDYGPEYASFSNAGIDGGIRAGDKASTGAGGGALIVFYSNNLKATQEKVEQAGGEINEPIFSFPGGRRFHFIEPSGNEFAVWGDPK